MLLPETGFGREAILVKSLADKASWKSEIFDHGKAFLKFFEKLFYRLGELASFENFAKVICHL